MQTELNKVAKQLNQRPSKTFVYRTTSDILNESIALTA
jgi:IS30 family transposase